MDIQTIGVAIAIAKSLPDTAAQKAEAAADRAEEHGYGLVFDGSILEISEKEGD